MLEQFDVIHMGLAAGALLGLFLWLFEVYRLKTVSARARVAEKELGEMKAVPGKHEYRIEQFDVLWYPTVVYDKKSFAIKEIKVGAPNCLNCGVPLSIGAAEFSCGKCGFKCPESVVSVSIIDQLSDKTKRFFELRYPTGL